MSTNKTEQKLGLLEDLVADIDLIASIKADESRKRDLAGTAAAELEIDELVDALIENIRLARQYGAGV